MYWVCTCSNANRRRQCHGQRSSTRIRTPCSRERNDKTSMTSASNSLICVLSCKGFSEGRKLFIAISQLQTSGAVLAVHLATCMACPFIQRSSDGCPNDPCTLVDVICSDDYIPLFRSSATFLCTIGKKQKIYCREAYVRLRAWLGSSHIRRQRVVTLSARLVSLLRTFSHMLAARINQ